MRIDKVCAFFLAVGIIFGGLAVGQRLGVEKGYTNYEVIMDHQELVKLAATAGENIEVYGKSMAEAGVTGVAITEESIDSISQNPNYHVRYYLLGYDLMVEGEQEALEFIKKGLEETLKEPRTIEFEAKNLLRIQGDIKDFVSNNTKVKDYLGNNKQVMNIYTGSKLVSVGLGFNEQKIKTMETTGMKINLRPTYYSGLQDGEKSVNRFFETLDKYGIEQNFIVSSGGEVLGYGSDDYLAKKMNERGMIIVPIEDTTQRQHIKSDGQDKLIEDLHYNAVRGFTTWDYIQRRFDYKIPGHHKGEEIVNTFYRAISERNIRVIYFKPYIDLKEKYVTDIEIYKKTLSSLEKRLEEHNIVPGPIVAMKKWEFNPFMKIPAILGIIAAAFIVVDNIFKIKKKYLEILYVIGAFGFGGIYFADKSRDLLDKLFALMAAVFLPSLAICFVVAIVKAIYDKKTERKPSEAFMIGCFILFVSVVVSLVGAMFEVSMLSHNKYLLEMDIFKGVKISQLLPMGISVLLYFSYFGYKRKNGDQTIGISLREISKGLNENIKIWQVLLCVVLFVVVYVFIGRSGNDSGLSVSSAELFFRNVLESTFSARPRTKSMFLGFPSVIFVVYLAYINRYKLMTPLLILFVSIGQSNITNTFSHLRTPLEISFKRVSLEYVIALVVAVVATLCLNTVIISKNKLE